MARTEIDVLIVEDNPGDIALIEAALGESPTPMTTHFVSDGEEALLFLRDPENPRPRLVFLDLNLPGVSGREVLKAIKQDKRLQTIPVCVLSSSAADGDVKGAYLEHANSYVTKPVSLGEFREVVKAIEDFWVRVVKLPTGIS